MSNLNPIANKFYIAQSRRGEYGVVVADDGDGYVRVCWVLQNLCTGAWNWATIYAQVDRLAISKTRISARKLLKLEIDDKEELMRWML
jgi:hypothetical protein